MGTLGNILPWIHAAVAILLAAAILLQRSAEGLGSAFGGSGSGGVFHTKRGLEKYLFIGTIFLAIAFGLTSIAILLI